MDLWRISAWPGLSGVGGLHADGRWHSKGHAVIYAAEHPALAMIEMMAHLCLELTNIPLGLYLIRITVGAHAATTPRLELPSGWQANEPTTHALGNAWLESGAALLLPVSSAILAHATSYLINPAHPQATTHLTEHAPEAFWFDKRFLR